MADDHPATRYLAKAERAGMIDLAANLSGFNVGRKPRFADAGNMTGIESGTRTLSKRIDSRTIFARDSAYGPTGEAGAYTGSHGPLVAACRRSIRRFGVPSAEIANIKIMQQFGQVAERLPEDKFRFHEAKLLSIFALARRAIQGTPIWSSLATMGWTQARAVGFFELHWPDIPATTMHEALLLRELVKRKWRPPEIAAAEAQSVEAGVIHSPAIGTYMDVAPAIRVVYAPNDGKGMKPVLYFDRHGGRVPGPRSIDIQPSEPRGPRPRPVASASA